MLDKAQEVLSFLGMKLVPRVSQQWK